MSGNCCCVMALHRYKPVDHQITALMQVHRHCHECHSYRHSQLRDLRCYSPPSAETLLVNCPPVKVVAEIPDRIIAAEIMRAIITFRMCLSSIRGLR